MYKRVFLTGALALVLSLCISINAKTGSAFADTTSENAVVAETKDANADDKAATQENADSEKAVDNAADNAADNVAEKTVDDAAEKAADESDKDAKTEASAEDKADAVKDGKDEKDEKDEKAPGASPNVLVVDGLVLTEAERKVYDLTNVERRKRGLPTLRLDRRLMESARRQANWMARTGVFKHGRSGFAENIAMGQRSSLSVVVAWMNSSGHRRNMLNMGHGAIGIGAYQGRNGALYWCQQFSR